MEKATQHMTFSPKVQIVRNSTPSKFEHLPQEMILFFDTPIGKNAYHNDFKKLMTSVSIFLALTALFLTVLFLIVLPLVWIVSKKSLTSKHNLPLAVNISHPFVDQEFGGTAKVLVQLFDGHWVDVGEVRVRVMRDELQGGWLLVEDQGEYPTIGYFSERSERFVNRSLTIINQALALRDGANNVRDTIDDARQRERMESGLLERSWLEDEQGIEIDTPLTRIFTKNE
jgi:hypothetical protein